VCYYGGGIQNFLALAPEIKIPMLFHYADLDAHIPAEAVSAVKVAFASHADATVHTYPGADHGFNCWGRPMYQQQSAAMARGRTLEWLSQRLG
jgi:carboxymethylenebutenolidase